MVIGVTPNCGCADETTKALAEQKAAVRRTMLLRDMVIVLLGLDEGWGCRFVVGGSCELLCCLVLICDVVVICARIRVSKERFCHPRERKKNLKLGNS